MLTAQKMMVEVEVRGGGGSQEIHITNGGLKMTGCKEGRRENYVILNTYNVPGTASNSTHI